MPRLLMKAFILALLLFAAVPAVAGEGRTPVYSGPMVIFTSGKYVLTQNMLLMACGPPSILIMASDVDLDLNGFTVPACPGDTSIEVQEVDNVVIRNGTVKGGKYGIHFIGSAAPGNHKVVIEDVKAVDLTDNGFLLQRYTDFALRRNNAYGNAKEGILIDGGGMTVAGTIEGNQVEKCGGGITVRGGASVGIINNRLRDLTIIAAPPAQGGIVYDYSSAGLIENNTVQAITGGSGIYLGDSSGNKIHDNVVLGAAGHGICLAGNSDDNLVFENVSSMNGNDGLRVEGSGSHIDRNTLDRNCQNGTTSCWGLHFALLVALPGADNTYGRNTARFNLGAAASCPAAPLPAKPPTKDFCDEQPAAPLGNSSFNDNYMPTLF